MSEKIQKLVDAFARLPGIGPRQAMRLVMTLVEWSKSERDQMSSLISDLGEGALQCRRCFNLTDENLCSICRNSRRETSSLAVVERATDLIALERSGVFKGLYHVLGGAINPAGGILPDRLRIKELINRCESPETAPDEVIIATNATAAGETTALYLLNELKPLGVKVTRLARGMPSGLSVEYADEQTLAEALKNRK